MSSSTISDKYQKLSQIEHVLKRPNVYVSSINSEPQEIYVYDEPSDKIVKKTINYNPGLSKIYDEILVNSFDHVFRTRDSDQPVKRIDIEFDRVKNRISVKNDGKGIECIKHEKFNMYIPQMLFGELNSSSNYDDTVERFVSGVNGMGSKLTVIFSKYFNIETVGIGSDGKMKKFSMTIRDNMKIKEEPVLTNYNKAPYTKITFEPDLERFNMSEISDDMVSFMIKRCYDIAASCFDEDTKRVSVYVNKKKLNIKTFKDYIQMYVSKDSQLFYEKIDKNFFVGVVLNDDDNFEQVSFVNGSHTREGGSHVNYITKKLISHVDTIFKKKKIEAKSSFIKNKLMVFVNSFINRPEFSGQIKENLTTPSKNFSNGGKLDFTKQFITKFVKSGIVKEVESLINHKNQKELSKTDGKKKTRVKSKDAFDDAIKAGTKESYKCKLIITEGNSALNFASNGISIIGREYYGTYPLRGKILNVRNASIDKISKNEEIKALKEILGLRQGHVYTNLNELRYGGLVILTDSDVDGYHIKGLVINFIEVFWPELIDLGFVFSLATPIVKARKGKQCLKFYTLKEYEEFKARNENGWSIKYYKGLGTSDDYEAKESFEDFENRTICYTNKTKKAKECISLAFNKDRAQDRKDWLLNFNHDDVITQMSGDIEVDEFVHKELKHFSYDDIRRSIPSIIDGMKPTQRKILYASLKKFKNNKNEAKLIEFIGYVMSETLYHHGDASIASTSIGMADDFVGSNNINLLKPVGQYNSRQRGGDAAAPRYLNTQLCDITSKIFHSEDSKIINYLDEDGVQIEPEYYVPCIPYILVNGSVGIGTGFSTTVLPHNPKDLVDYIKAKLENKPTKKLIPWVRQYRGTISETETSKYMSCGKYEFNDDNNTVLVTELPYGMFVDTYKSYLEKICFDKASDKKDQRSQFIEYYNNYSTKIKVKFEIFFTKEEYAKIKTLSTDEILKKMKLTSNMSETNMYLFDKNNQIRKFKSAEEIIEYWYDIRYDFYGKRKANMIAVFEKEVSVIQNRVRFIREVIAKNIDILGIKKVALEQKLKQMKFDTIEGSFDYLIDMKIRTLTFEKASELEALLKQKLGELDILKTRTVKTMWLEDLSAIMIEDTKYNDKLNEKFDLETINHGKGKKITKARKTKKTTKKVTKKVSKKVSKKTMEI